MMDFDNVLSLASQNQGGSNVQKRYSLQTRPPKKDPKSKGVSAAAVQALLKKQHIDHKTKEMQMKKQKEELLAKRVELKSDRKARAMASRTKDNFRGYNGIPVVEIPKKRNSKLDVQEDRDDTEQFRNSINDPEDEDNYEYEQTDSESEQEPQPQKKTINYSSCKSSKKTSAPPKSAPLNFADLLKLAEKKQHEPVDVKPKVIKKEERLRTADEIRELELERKAKKYDKDVKGEKLRDGMSQSSSSSTKGTLEKDQINGKLQRSKMSNSTEKQLQPQLKDDTRNNSSKASVNDRNKPKLSHDRDKYKQSFSSSSNATSNKMLSKPTHSQALNKQMGTKLSSSHKSTNLNDLGAKKEYSSSLQGRSVGTPDTRPSGSTSSGKKHQPTRPPQGVLHRQGVSTGAQKRGEPQRPNINATVKSNVNSLTKPALSGTSKPNQAQSRPGGTSQIKLDSVRPGVSGVRPPGMAPGRPPGIAPGRTVNGGLAPGRVSGSLGVGPGTPKCTVVSETISSKNVGGPKTGVPPHSGITQRPGMQQRPGVPQRPPGMPQRPPGMPQRPPGMPQRPPGMPQRPPGMPQRPPGMPQRPPGMPQRPPGMPQRPPGMPMNRPPGTMLPPITSAYKRKYEDEEEYDSEMDDFIDDGDDDQDEVSKHIKEIFGYDRTKYKDESDYALKFMESSWKDLQKEEARSLRLAVQEDLEEEKREEEEIKRQSAKRKKRS